jgi:hypothetical protein
MPLKPTDVQMLASLNFILDYSRRRQDLVNVAEIA